MTGDPQAMSEPTIEDYYVEDRTFPPSEGFVASALLSDGSHYEEAAADLGATPWQTFWLVTLPRIWPGILSGAMLAFTLSFDDFVVTFFTAGIGSGTLPLKIYSMVKFGVTPEVNAISTIALSVTLAVLFLYQKLQPKD